MLQPQLFFSTFLSFFLFLCFSSSSSVVIKSFSDGPVIAENFADPAFIEVPNDSDGSITYYAFATNNAHGNIPVAVSTNFVNWTIIGDALPVIPTWSYGSIWAPDVVQVQDTFVMYMAAGYKGPNGDNSHHCVGTATSQKPDGPYVPTDSPFACHLSKGGAIDPDGFLDVDGRRYVTYKIDGGSLGGGGPCGNGDGSHSTAIMLQEVNPMDGITPMGAPIPILDRSAADGPLIEAPSLVRTYQGLYVLFFSSNCFNTDLYDISYATSSFIAGPYQKAPKPLLVSGSPTPSNGPLKSPGGADVAIDGTRILFHSDLVKGDPKVREMWAAEIEIV